MSKLAGGYTKGSRIKFERFVDGIDLAIEQAGSFEEEPRKIMTEIGTSMGQLIRKMKRTDITI